jgi:hypothetical protein
METVSSKQSAASGKLPQAGFFKALMLLTAHCLPLTDYQLVHGYPRNFMQMYIIMWIMGHRLGDHAE